MSDDDTGLTARKIEQILRANGVSKSIARAIVAGGWKGAADQAEVEAEATAALVKAINAATARLKGLSDGPQ